MLGKHSIKLGLVIGAIIFFSVVISYFSIENRLTKILITATKKELYRDLLFNKQMFEEEAQELHTTEQSNAWVERIALAFDIRVTLIDIDGEVIADSSVPPGKLYAIESHWNRPEVQDAIKTGYGERTRYSQTVKEHMLYMAIPVGSPKPYAILRFGKPIYDIGGFDTGIHKEFSQGLFVALFVSLIAGFFGAFFLARPLQALAKTAQKRMQGEFSGTIPVRSKDETGVLARTLNFMTVEIIKLRRSEEWFQAVFSGIREAIIVTDAAGDIILVNPAASRMFRIDGTMLKSRPIRHLSDNKLQELFARVHSTRITLRKEELALITTKGERILQISSMPLTKEGEFEGTVFVLNDITKLRNLEKIRRDFVSSVSHELRTPLTVITGYTETLLEGAMHEPEHATSFLQIIQQASEQLTALVNDLLDLSKIESGYIEYQFTAVDLKRVVQQSIELLKSSINKKQIKLNIIIPDDLPPVYADARYLDIAIRNLLDNAIKYVDDHNGKIRISAFRSGEDIRLEIGDNGIGISKSDIGRIFERFFRVDKARSRQQGGTGLGLAIVKHIILAHNGNVEVRSRVNHGSVFSLILKIAKAEKNSLPPASCPNDLQ
ncbi:MAG: cell wall metabolism sensor histidine kinase WalK [Chlorobium sp.]|nr:cell wall metabolism sensor histidine kinase WalK [Chlorobium sp.]